MSGKQQQNGSSEARHHFGTAIASCLHVLRSKGRVVVVPPAELAGAGLSPLAARRDLAAPFSGGGCSGPRLVPSFLKDGVARKSSDRSSKWLFS